MTELLSICGLAFSFGKRLIFRDLNLSAVPGGVLCLMGPNGCGKTTLLDCIMSLLTPDAGEVRLMGKPVNAYRRHELAQRMSFVPQIHEITFPYTVREVVLMGRTAHAASHLDFRNEMRFLETVVDLCRNENLSVVMATHAPDQAFYFSSKSVPVTAALFDGGTVRYLGRPEDVVNEETIRAVYGVKARILTDTAEDGTVIRTVTLIESDPEENR
jgi:ABC-type cobalamin/Fe3+-siderophores transport system ATPase subunit